MMHTKENQQRLEAVHTHTHTHTHTQCLYKKENGIFTRESLKSENKGFICNAIILLAEKLYIKYKELKVNMLLNGGDAPYE